MVVKESEMLEKNLKLLRAKKGWSQQRLAEAAGLSYATITKLEQGRGKEPAIHSMVKLADALGVTLDDLIGRTPPRPSKK
jgi:transcriptional regulator with XRE-family HTH domain